MALENFNVFGMIFVTKVTIKITATAFSGKQPKSISNTFRVASKNLAGLVIPFAARVGKSDIPVLYGERPIMIDSGQVTNAALYADDLRSLEKRIEKFLEFFGK